jgi:carbon storage regulator
LAGPSSAKDVAGLPAARRWPGTGRAKQEACMLVLSRKKNEQIVINDEITIVVVEIREDKVRIGVEAPKAIPVHRREVFDKIHRFEGTVGVN